jgi:hypothetical protein
VITTPKITITANARLRPRAERASNVAPAAIVPGTSPPSDQRT